MPLTTLPGAPSYPLVVAAVQPRCSALDIEVNVATAAAAVLTAAEAGARVILFPELYLTGYELAAIVADPARRALVPDDPRLGPLAAACARSGATAIVGAPVADRGLRISAVVVGPAGREETRYDKQHLDAAERAAGFVPGECGCTLLIGGWNLGLGICWDSSFPEHARAAALDGCHGYLLGGMFKKGSGDLKRNALGAARALENSFYVAFANHGERSGPYDGSGRSALWAPDGTLLADAGDLPGGMAVATLDPEPLALARSSDLTLVDPSLDTERGQRRRTTLVVAERG